MSLERSVVQVALAMETPIIPAFRQIVDAQRQKGAEGIDMAKARLAQIDRFPTRSAFETQLTAQMADIDALRREIDAQLAAPLSERNPARVYELPFALKNEISGLKNAIELIRSDAVIGSAVAGALEKTQSRAWEGREYSGRARTYFAIATLNKEALRSIDQPVIRLDKQRADEAWRAIEKVAMTITPPRALEAAMTEVSQRYYQDYTPWTARIQEISAAGAQTPDYGISFEDFFAVSNAGLEAFEVL